MLGKSLFATRRRLLDAFDAVLALAKETDVSPTWAEDPQELRERLERPLLFTVCGEINAGKSALINAIQGSYLCRVNDLPETDMPTLHVHGTVRRDSEQAGKWRECQWPEESLRQLHWLDLPGVEALGKSALQTWQPWLEGTDVLLVVFPFRNPWGAATWDFVARLPETLRSSMAFVVQQCDEAVAADLPVLLEHMRELAVKRIGVAPPVFLVSARQAFEAKTQARSAHLLAASGVPVLEAWLEERIHHCPERTRALESLRRASLGLLHQVDEQLDGAKRSIHRDVRFLEGLEREIDALLHRTVRQQIQGLGAIGEEFSQQSHGIARLLQSRLGIFRSLWRMMRGENTAQRLELLLQERLTDSVKEAAARDASALIDECAAHWRTVVQRIDEQTGVSAAAWAEIESRLQQARQQLVERMGRAASLSIGQLRVRGVLGGALRQRNEGLSMWMMLFLVAVIGAGICGGLFLPWLPLLLSGLALFFWICLSVFAVRSAREMVFDYRDRLLRSGEVFFAALRGDYEEGLRLFFREYAQGLQSVRVSLVQRENALQPYLQRWNELFLKIKAIEQEMSF
jgi:hypothetical protein